MLSWFILGVALLVSALLILRWASTADPRTLVRVLKWVLIGLVVLLALVFVLTGRAAWALAGLHVATTRTQPQQGLAVPAETFAKALRDVSPPARP